MEKLNKYADLVIAIVRITLGLLLLQVGKEMFTSDSMKGYID
jgi:hypothetical protein